MDELPTIFQSLTVDQIREVAGKCGVTEGSVKDVIDFMNRNDHITLGLVEMTPDMVIGFILCEMQYGEGSRGEA